MCLTLPLIIKYKMKRTTSLLVLMCTIVLMTSCSKKDDPNPQTIQEKYPELANLTWVATYENGVKIDDLIAQKLDVKIVGNLITVTNSQYQQWDGNRVTYIYTYDKVSRYEDRDSDGYTGKGYLNFYNSSTGVETRFNYEKTGNNNGDYFWLGGYKLLINR